MKKFRRTLMLILAAVALSPFHTASADSRRTPWFSIREIGTLGGSESFAYAINAHGEVVGSSRVTGDLSIHSFLYRRGVLTDLFPLNSESILTIGPTGISDKGLIASGVIGADGVYYPAIHDGSGITILGSLGAPTWYQFSGTATSVNNRGQAVGYSYVDGEMRHAFLYSNGVMTDIGSNGGYSGALGINEAGEVVGFASDTPFGIAHAFVYSNGVTTVINPFGGPDNEGFATGINHKGQVVGQGITPEGNVRAFVYSNGLSRGLGTLRGGHNSAAYAVNNRGLIVGIADYPYRTVCWDPYTATYLPCIRYAQHGFLYDQGVMMDLNSLIPEDEGWDLEWAFDINDRGQIVGYGRLNGVYRAYVLTPCESRGNGRAAKEQGCRPAKKNK
jgi:probable HAF family extracellular repeat protein